MLLAYLEAYKTPEPFIVWYESLLKQQAAYKQRTLNIPDLEIEPPQPAATNPAKSAVRNSGKEPITQFGDYSVEITSIGHSTDYVSGYKISYKGKVVRRFSSVDILRIDIGHLDNDKWPNDHIEMGKDITGNGVPNLVLNFSTGGAHCCYSYDVFELGPKLKRIGSFDVADAFDSRFEKQGDDSNLVFVTRDYTFRYWNASFTGSPAPDVKLRYCNGKYRLAADLMRKPPPPEAELDKLADQVRQETFATPPPLLWDTMLDLIYSGNEKEAYRFLDKAWPPLPRKSGPTPPGYVKLTLPASGPNIRKKQNFVREFRRQLAISPYWQEISAMNRKQKYNCAEVEPNHERALTYIVHGEYN
jgi:hypothetical protein